jgi:methylphosphotriester-DNA--protein-cysteine methyltransferase
VVIIGAVAELERNLIIERVRAGMRRARLEGRQIGRKPLELDRDAIWQDRPRALSLAQIAKAHRISRATVHRVLHAHARRTSSRWLEPRSKRVLKTALANPTKQMAGSQRSGRSIRCTFKHTATHMGRMPRAFRKIPQSCGVFGD